MQPSSSEPSLSPEQVLDCLEAIALCIRQTQSLDHILNTAAQQVRKILQTDRILVYRFQPDGSGVVVVESVGSSWTPILNQIIHDPCFEITWAEPYRQGRISALADIYTSDIQPCYVEFLAQFQVRANLVMPLKQGENLWGLLIAHHCTSPRQWQPLEVNLLQQLAVQMSVAIQLTELYQQDQTKLQERKEVEQELKIQQEFLHNVIDTNPNLICVKDWDGRFRLVNQALADIYGTTVEDLTGKTDADFSPTPAQVEQYLQDDRQVMCTLQPKFIPEETLTDATGEVHYLQTIKKPLLSTDGKVRYVLATATDITARKRAEQERDYLFQQLEQQNQILEAKVQERTAQLRQTNEQLLVEIRERQRLTAQVEQQARTLDTVLCASPDEIYMIDRAGRFLYVNHASLQAMSALLQRQEPLQLSEIVGKSGHELGFPPELMEPHETRLERIFVTSQPLGGETSYLLHNEIRYQDYTLTPISDSDGGVEAVVITNRDITKRKRAEEELRESEARFRRLFESNIVGIIFADFSGRITQANDLFLQMVDYTREDLLLGKVRWDEMTPPEYRHLERQTIEQCRITRVCAPWEKEFIRKDGSSVPVLIGGALLDGSDDQSIAFVLEISDRKQVEEELTRSEQRWQLVLKGNNDGIWDLDLKTNKVFRSARWMEILGYLDHELSNDNDEWVTRIHPDDFDRVMQANQDYWEQKIPHYAVEYRLRCKDGSYKWVLGRAQAVWDEAGNPVRMVGSTTDISDRKRAEEALRESEKQFRQIFQEAPIGMALADFQTNRLTQVNPAYCQLLGYSASELASLKFDDITHPDDLPQDFHYIEQSERGKLNTYRMEKRYLRNNGEVMWANLTVTALRDQDGKPKFTLGMIEDITQRRQLQIELQHSEERFRTSVENMLDCFGMYSAIRDHTGQIVDFLIEYVNPATCTFNRTPKEEQIGKRLCELLPTHRETGLFDEYSQVVETGQPLVKESLLFKDTINSQHISGAFDLRAVKLGDGMAVAWRDITERKQAEDQIKASLLEKETLLKEIHHRVKNNLQVISSLLRLQSRQIRDQQALELFKEGQNRVQAMALIHEKLYQSSNLAFIDFQDYITSLVGNLCRSYDIHRQAITFKVNVNQVSLPIDTAIPCGLIINELVSNSLKYAFPDSRSGEICISLQESDSSQFILTISDNGVGLPENLDFRNTSSLGLQLVCRLSKQLEGNIELNRNQGTEFKIAFANTKS